MTKVFRVYEVLVTVPFLVFLVRCKRVPAEAQEVIFLHKIRQSGKIAGDVRLYSSRIAIFAKKRPPCFTLSSQP